MDKITRTFLVNRNGNLLEYKFQTDTRIFGQAETLNEILLNDHLRRCFMSGYPDREGKESVSAMTPLVREKKLSKSDLTKYIEDSCYIGKGNKQHDIVQQYLHDNLDRIIATEVPVWDDTCHGFIDALLWTEDGKLEIFDFKPNARQERKAASQVYRYGNLLSQRTGISRSDIITTYGDHTHYYTVE
jgi:hypothetical protein